MRSKKSRQPNLCVHLHLVMLAKKIHEPQAQAEPEERQPDVDQDVDNEPQPTGESASATSGNTCLQLDVFQCFTYLFDFYLSSLIHRMKVIILFEFRMYFMFHFSQGSP